MNSRHWVALLVLIAFFAGVAAISFPARAEGIAGDGFLGRERDEGEGEGFGGELSEAMGKGALLALAANAAYVPYKWLRPQLPILRLIPLPLALQVHIVAGLMAVGLGTVHALAAGESNPWLWLGLGLMFYETAGGFLMRRQELSRPARRSLFLLHAQRVTFALLGLALFVGHAVLELD